MTTKIVPMLSVADFCSDCDGEMHTGESYIPCKVRILDGSQCPKMTHAGCKTIRCAVCETDSVCGIHVIECETCKCKICVWCVSTNDNFMCVSCETAANGAPAASK